MPIIYDSTSKNANGGTELMMRGLEERLDPELSKHFSIGRALMLLDPKSIRVYWTHNLPNQLFRIHAVNERLALSSNSRWQYNESIVFVSEWQKQQYINYYKIKPFEYSKLKVIHNTIAPVQEHTKPDKKLRIIYTSVPNKGLTVLYPVFKRLAQKYPIELEVYSSFALYGMENVDAFEHQELLEQLKQDPCVIYHKYGTNQEVLSSLQNSHIYACPSTYPETSCIALIEAMSAKCLCVHSDNGALPETSAGHTNIYKYHSNQNLHEAAFEQALEKTIKQYLSGDISHLDAQKQYVDSKYSWSVILPQWENHLNSLLQPKQMRA